MYATERQQEITSRLQRDGRVSVVELATTLGVTTETIRRDLDQLETLGSARRVHGGAVRPERSSTAETSVRERSATAGEAKDRIAERALALITPGFRGSILLDAGTTTHRIAAGLGARLAAIDGAVDVVTHSMLIAAELTATERIDLTAIGGRVRGLTAAAVGADAVAAVAGLRPDVAVIGTNGLSADFGLSTPDPDEAAMKTAIVRAARRVIVVADATKFDQELLVSFAPLSAIDVLVTESLPGPALTAALADAGVEVVLP